MSNPYKKTVLDNGLTIVSCDMTERASLALGIWIRVGGRYEEQKIKGISHFIEHLLFKGSKSYSCREIKESIEGIGGSLNGFTSEELTCYLAKIPASHLEPCFKILADMVLNPLFDQEELTKEKTVILEEIKMYRDQPQSHVYELLDELMWPNQPLGFPIAGFPESVTSMSRSDLLGFKEGHYTASNMVVSAAGCLKNEKLVALCKKIFPKTKPVPINKFIPVVEKQASAQLKLLDKATEQTHMVLGFHSFKRDHPLKYALGLLNIILGGNMSSRLFNEVRELKGLAYEIGTGIKRFFDTGAFVVHAGIDNRKVIDALTVILNELRKIKEEQVSEDEFRRAKEFYLGQLKLGLEDTLEHMLWIGESTTALNKIYTPESIIKEVNKVKRSDLREVANEIFQDKSLNLSLIGPLEGKQEAIASVLHID